MLARIRKSLNKDENQGGFTLIELLVVMIIIGILAAIAIPAFLNQKVKAAETGAKSDATNIAKDLAALTVDGDLAATPTATTAGVITYGYSSPAATGLSLTSSLTSGNTVTAVGALGDKYCVTVQANKGGAAYGSAWTASSSGLKKVVGTTSGVCTPATGLVN